MLKKLGADLLYLMAKSIDRYDDNTIKGNIIHTDYAIVLIGRVEEANEEELEEIKQQLLKELSKKHYLRNKNFLKNLDLYFNNYCEWIKNPKEFILYKIIKESFITLKTTN